ncbi:hypothetical protein Q8W71_17080 [Methylobacterium sp. NEAU 140]|uniref:helix-turn-helix transcriptional regulator n=1 Tax=Methylobacterium sp. NEAU 140 TaxID=3064945 RepID=UPI002733CE36|nr:hypothetical protein [Methylobacterium sp. NEAU 140]MDP4024343.1 hypothetical protein [Methylobacterium sp. NEAU 140]
MDTFEFSVVATGLDPGAPDFEARFYEAGCDDATISFQKGHIIVDFAREAENIAVAIGSALAAVERAGASVERVEPDPLVSLADIAQRTGMSRAAMTQYAKGQRAEGFPRPVAKVTSDSPLWDWASVSLWLAQRQKLGHAEVIRAAAVKQANAVIEAGSIDVAEPIRRRLRELAA